MNARSAMRIRFGIALLLASAPAIRSFAQQAEDPAAQAAPDVAAPAPTEPADPAASTEQAAPSDPDAADGTTVPNPPAASPPPGEDVMRPTTHGVRMTPDMARAMSSVMARGVASEHGLNRDQQRQLADAYAARLMRVTRTWQDEGQAFLEYALESLWMTGPGNTAFTPEMAAEFSRRALPVLPAMRELLDGMMEDARPLLDEDALQRLSNGLDDTRRQMARFEEKMQRWSRGEIAENEHPFSDLEDPATQPAEGTAAPPQTPEVRHAEQMADWELSTSGVNEWRRFLSQVQDYFEFDNQQTARGEAILADYITRADALMTPEWKQSVRQNRIKFNLRHQLRGVPTIPWMWRLQHEYDTALRPIRELGWAFRKDVLALLTPQQRQKAVSDIAGRAREHGLTLEEADQAVLGVAGESRWGLWRF